MKQSSPARHPEFLKSRYCDHIYRQHRHRRHCHHHLLETRLWIQHFKKQEPNYYYYYHHHHHHHHHHHRIYHFSALAGKYSPILGCSNQQD